MQKNTKTQANTNEKSLLPLSNDYVFKRVFGKDGNENILKSLLEAILKIKIKSIEIKNPEIPKEIIDEKSCILDIKAVINEDTLLDIEMQVGNKNGLEKRLVIYGSKLIAGDIKVSEKYISARDTIVICLVNENVTNRNSYLSVAKIKFEETEENRYVDMGYKKENEVLTEMVKYYIIELDKFKKKKPALGDELEKWLYTIGGDEKMMEKCSKENTEIGKAVDELKKISADERERQIYEAREKAMIDEGIIRYETREEGRKEGIAIGEARGKKEGKREKEIEIAKNLLRKKMPINDISEVTDLSKKEIESLSNK